MRAGLTLALILALSACQIQLVEPPSPETPTTPARKARPTVRPSLAPSASPTAIATPTPSPTPIATPTPSVPMRLLKGLVRIDAGYAVSVGAGRIISSNGGSLIEANAGSLISDKGLGLIGNHGAGLISNNGGSLIGNNGGGYRLLDAPAIGAMLPVKGMMVAPVSLVSGAQLGPAVLTDDTGAYTLQVPESQRENVLILAGIPAKDEADPILQDARLSYGLIAAPTADAERAIDEDTAIVTQYLRQSFVARLHEILTTDDARVEAILVDGWSAPEVLKTMMLALMKDLRAEAAAIGIDAMTEPQQRALAYRLTGVALAQLELDLIRMDGQYYPGYTGPMDLALPAMAEFFQAVREAAALRLTADPTFFDQQPYMTAANADRAESYRVIKPSDLGDFMVEEYMAVNDSQVYFYIDEVMESLDRLMAPDGSYKRTSRLRCAADTVVFKIGEAMLMNKNGTKDKVLQAIRTFEP